MSWRQESLSADVCTQIVSSFVNIQTCMNEYYRHFRNGKLYRFVTFATIEATGEEAVVYQAMYGDHRYWIRPRANFFEEVEYEGKMVPRFQKVENAGE